MDDTTDLDKLRERVEEIRRDAEDLDQNFGINGCLCALGMCNCDYRRVIEAAAQRRELLAAYDAQAARSKELEGKLRSIHRYDSKSATVESDGDGWRCVCSICRARVVET